MSTRIELKDCVIEADDERHVLVLHHAEKAVYNEKFKSSPIEIPYAALSGYEMKKKIRTVFILNLLPEDVPHPGSGFTSYDLYAFTTGKKDVEEVVALLDDVVRRGSADALAPDWVPTPQTKEGIKQAKNRIGMADSRNEIKRSMENSSRIGAGLSRLPDGLDTKDIVAEFGGLFVTSDSIWYEGSPYSRSGARAKIDTGAAARNRVSATRVVGGAMLLGPVGAILGSTAKKDEGMVFVTVDLPDGLFMIAGGSAKKIRYATELVRAINNPFTI